MTYFYKNSSLTTADMLRRGLPILFRISSYAIGGGNESGAEELRRGNKSSMLYHSCVRSDVGEWVSILPTHCLA